MVPNPISVPATERNMICQSKRRHQNRSSNSASRSLGKQLPRERCIQQCHPAGLEFISPVICWHTVYDHTGLSARRPRQDRAQSSDKLSLVKWDRYTA